MIKGAVVEFTVGERLKDPFCVLIKGTLGDVGDCLLCSSYIDLDERILLKLELPLDSKSVGETFPLLTADESTFNEG
jgi:hypothetical protein